MIAAAYAVNRDALKTGGEKVQSRVLAFAGFAISIAASGVAQEKSAKCTGPQDACQQIIELWKGFDVATTRDGSAIAAFFTDDAVWVLPGIVVSGKQAIEKYASGNLKAGWGPDTATVDEVHVTGDMAWVVGHWTESAPGANNTMQQFQGRWGSVHVREGSNWKIRMSTVNLTAQ